MRRYFITGTDTDCGKTYVTCRLIRYFKKSKQHVLGIKPVASGCELQDTTLVSLDALQLQAANETTVLDINPWRFQPPIAPHLAAEQENTRLTVKQIADYCTNSSFAAYDYLFIEGAGGLMVPLNSEETWLDFLQKENIAVILVVGMKLGCLNHALLTFHALKNAQVPCAGWIANCIDPNMLQLEKNIETLKTKIDAPLLALIPYAGEIINDIMLTCL